MASLEARFRRLASQLEPTAVQKARAKEAQNGLRERLKTGRMRLRVKHMYLSGSYIRSTALRPLEDVDIIAEIDREHWDRGFFGKLLDRPPPARMVVEKLARSLRGREGRSGSAVRVRQQRVSVGVVTPSLTIDVVPAIPDAQNPDLLRIPVRKSQEWIVTAPRVHSRVTSELNDRHGGRFVPLVKIAKGWNRAGPSTARMKGFAIEVMAAHLFGAHPIDSLEQGLEAFFDFLSSFGDEAKRDWRRLRVPVDLRASSAMVADTAGLGGNVLARVDSEKITKFVRRAGRARAALEAASRESTVGCGWAQVSKLFRPRQRGSRTRSGTSRSG